MIENFCTALISELQATGILLIGLYIILLYVAREISRPLKVMNHNSTETVIMLKEIVKALERIGNGKI